MITSFTTLRIDHHQQHHKSTFSDFWFEHYTGSDTDQDDEDSDSSLPFKGYTPVPAFIAFVSETEQHIKPAPMTAFHFPEPLLAILQPELDTPWEPPC